MPKAACAEGPGLWYQDRGPRRAPTVLALHGVTGTHRTWRDLARLADQGCLRLLAPDLPGHGRTGGCDPVVMTMSRTAEALLGLPLPSRFHLIGYSMGARLALHVARRAPERIASLVLESGSPGLAATGEREDRRVADERWARMLEREGIRVFQGRWSAQPLFESQRRLPAAVRRRIARERIGQNPRGLAASLRGAGTGSQESLWEDLDRLRMPTLLVVGDLDQKFQGVGLAMVRRLENARLVTMANCGHAPHLEAPRSFWSEVAAFWRALSEPLDIAAPESGND